MESTQQVAQFLNDTLSPEGDVRHAAREFLDRFSLNPDFPFALISIATGGENQGQCIAAATYLKNFTRRSINESGAASKVNKEFRDALVRTLLQAEPVILKVLIEAFRSIVDAEFVKGNSWPELVPELRSAIQDSDLINKSGNSSWKTINALTVLHSVIRPFQYFLNPKLAKEPVPLQLDLISQEILVPLIAVFHQCVEEMCVCNRANIDAEKSLLIMCKCIYFAVRSHMPSVLAPLLPSLCHDLIRILDSLRFQDVGSSEDGSAVRLKSGKRSLLIFSALVTRHRKFFDKLMPFIVDSAVKLVKCETDFSKLDILSERIVSLGFDVISRILETGPGWRLVSSHFSSLLESAIFPVLVMNEKDIVEWEEDGDEYIRRNLPSELEAISGWREDLFTPRKSALNLVGVISMSKGPPVAASVTSKRKKGDKNKQNGRSSMGELLVLPFLSKFPIPSDVNIPKSIKEYCGVLMAYGSLIDFLREQKPAYTTMLIRSRVLPLYRESFCHPYLVASANWILGELVSCIPEEMSGDIYSSLLKALTMADMADISGYPVRASAAGAIAQLVENDMFPPEWLPVLQVVVGRIRDNNEEETSIMFELLKTLVEAGSDNVAPHIPHIISVLAGDIFKHLPPNPEPWPQMVERGFAALSSMAQCWEEFLPEKGANDITNEISVSGRTSIAKAFMDLLQQAWLRPVEAEGQVEEMPPPCCIDDSSSLLSFIMSAVNESDDGIQKEKVSELLLVWANLIADWHAWEEEEDLPIFNCIKDATYLHKRISLKNFIMGNMPSPLAPLVRHRSIIEGICAFVCEAFSQYPSAIYKASSSVHILLHVPTCSSEDEHIMHALTIAVCQSVFSCFRQKQSKPSPLWKLFLLAISSCYLRYPDIVENTLEKDQHGGFKTWASALCFISSSKFEHGLSAESEIKLTVMTLAKVIARLLKEGNQSSTLLWDCFAAVMEASLQLKVQEEDEEIDVNEDETASDEDSEDVDDEDEESEDEDREETEEEFLDRCAKAAVDLENGTIVEEVDEEDEELEIELGGLDEVDQLSIVQSLMEKHHQILLQGPQLPQELISSFLDAFPECVLYFQQHQK